MLMRRCDGIDSTGDSSNCPHSHSSPTLRSNYTRLFGTLLGHSNMIRSSCYRRDAETETGNHRCVLTTDAGLGLPRVNKIAVSVLPASTTCPHVTVRLLYVGVENAHISREQRMRAIQLCSTPKVWTATRLAPLSVLL